MKYLALLLVFCFVGCNDVPRPAVTQSVPESPRLTLLSQRVERINDTMVGVHGEIKNSGSIAAERVVLTVAGYDKRGQLIRTDQGPLNPDPVMPGQTATFSIYLLDAPGFNSHKVTATIGGESVRLDTQTR